MDDYMVAIINGGKEDGKITYLGYKFNFKYHAQCLIDYASKKYPNISGFSKLDYMKEPNSPIYYLTLLGNIVFTNISVDGEKRGMLYFPRKISDEQVKVLHQFIKTINFYDVWIVYHMTMVDGMVVGESFDVSKNFSLEKQIDNFIFEKMNKEVGYGKKY